MAKASKMPTKVEPYAYPDRFGSHRSMLVRETEGGMCICQDEFGEYITETKRLDNGCADSNRYRESRIKDLFTGQKKE
jgi:hypothetical protein